MDWENYATTQFKGQLLDGDFTNVAPNDDTDADEQIDIIEQWKPLTDLILNTTEDSWEDSPFFDPSSPSEFQSYWLGIFCALRNTVRSNEDIPQNITDPPVKGFDVEIFDQYSMCCPCSNPSVPQNIKIFREHGVTKEDVVNAIGTYLYGMNDLPMVYGFEDEGKPIAQKGAIIYHINWMSQRSKNGDSAAFPCYFAKGHQIVSVVVYCCSKSEYPKKRAELKRKQQEQQERAEKRVAEAEMKESEVEKTGELRKEVHDGKMVQKLGRKRADKLRTTERAAERGFVTA